MLLTVEFQHKNPKWKDILQVCHTSQFPKEQPLFQEIQKRLNQRNYLFVQDHKENIFFFFRNFLFKKNVFFFFTLHFFSSQEKKKEKVLLELQ